MSSEVEKAAEKLAKLQAQAERYSTPLAEAHAALEAARVAETERQAERRKQYSRDYLKTYRERADAVIQDGKAAHERFKELISAEPWFIAYAEYRAGREKRRHVLDAAQAAQTVLGEVNTIPEQRWYESSLLQDIVKLADAKATEIGGEYDKELTAERDAYVKGTD
ncbi:hypothetical protein OG948_24540 [Embleya sp. NBC_00888]|uniref:hypothetical protein n=1 Tax=Embleya sp. NBC_00888 TaxID=2975960 RepID=UPI003863F140|nr:hypothetical protein OG948_24540 [Embleya sp. NBC_00888]